MCRPQAFGDRQHHGFRRRWRWCRKSLEHLRVRLRHAPAKERRIAIILANYPNRDGRIGNGVGYDTPASTLNILKAMTSAGYAISDIPDSGNALLEVLLRGPTNSH